MNYCKLHRLFFTGALSLVFAFNAVALESRMQHKARELEMRGDYMGAIDLYKKDMAKKGRGATSQEGVARCYYALYNFEQAETAYAQLVGRNRKKNKNGNHMLTYAEIMLRNGKYAEASELAKELLTDSAFSRQARRLVATCDSAAKWSAQPLPYEVKNLDNINTCYGEWGVQFSTPSAMLFISDRTVAQPNNKKGRAQGIDYIHAFTAKGNKIDTLRYMQWSAPTMLPYPFNEANVHIGPLATVTNDSSLIYYTRSSKKGITKNQKIGKETIREARENLEIYSAKKTDKGWGSIVPFEHNNASQYSVMHPCLSIDGKILYFVSDMPGGVGGLDIWYCEQQAGGKWSRPINVGKPINTPQNEVFPTMGIDGTLYFSSDGHKGMGGLDLFASKREKNKWSPVRNLKAPLNSSADDFLMITKSDSTGYFSSNRPGGKGGDDIYMYMPQALKPKSEPVDTTPAVDSTTLITVDTIQPAGVGIDTTPIISEPAIEVIPEPMETTPIIVPIVVPEKPQTILLSGRVVDKQTQIALAGAKICATHDATKTSQCLECSSDGTFNFELKPDNRYTISGFKEGYQSTAPLRLLATSILAEDELSIEMMAKVKTTFQSAQEVIDRAAATAPVKRSLPREFRIQILANWKETDYEYFTRLRHAYPQFELQYTKRDRATRFTYGSFVNLQEARRYLRLFINLGYTDSFITVFEYGRQVESIYLSGSKDIVRK